MGWNKILAFIILMLAVSFVVKACEIEFKVEGKKKEKYDQGDEIIVKVTVTFTHRVCQLGIENTQFNAKGLKIESATKWKEVSENVWERKLKIKVTGTESGKMTLTGTRTCDKEGGKGSINLYSLPLKK